MKPCLLGPGTAGCARAVSVHAWSPAPCECMHGEVHVRIAYGGRGGVRRRAGMQSRARGVRGIGGLTSLPLRIGHAGPRKKDIFTDHAVISKVQGFNIQRRPQGCLEGVLSLSTVIRGPRRDYHE